MKNIFFLIMFIVFFNTIKAQQNNALIAIYQLEQFSVFEEGLFYEFIEKNDLDIDKKVAKVIYKFSDKKSNLILNFSNYKDTVTIEKINTLYLNLLKYKGTLIDKIKSYETKEKEELNDKIKKQKKEINKINKKYKITISNIEALKKVTDSLKQQDTILSLDVIKIEKYDDLIKLIERKDNLENQSDSLTKNIKYYKIFLKNIKEDTKNKNKKQDEIEVKKYFQITHVNIVNDSKTYQQTSGFNFPSQTDMIDALAIFVAKRMKQEAILFFFQTFKDDLENSKMLKNLFPSTLDMFNSYNYNSIPTFGSMWKASFAKDIVELPENIANNFNFKNKEQALFYKNMIQLSTLYISNKNPIDILSYMKDNQLVGNETTSSSQNFYNLLSLLIILNENLVDNTGESSWIKFKNFKQLSEHKWKQFFGLVYIQNKVFLKDTLNWEMNDTIFKKFKLGLSEVLLNLNYFDEINKNTSTILKNENKEKYEQQTLNAYFNILISTLNFINLFAEDEKIGKYVEITNNTLNIYNSVIEKNYQGIATNSLNIFKLLIDNEKDSTLFKKIVVIEELNTKIEDIKNLIDSVSSDILLQIELKALFESLKNDSLTLTDYTKKLDTLIVIIKEIKIPDTLKESISKFEKEFRKEISATHDLFNLLNKDSNFNIQEILKYTSLIVDVLNAKNSEELEQIISAHALPVGSYNLKRTSRFSIELNAFPGIFGAYEMELPQTNNGGFVTGFTSPIGLSFNWGRRKQYKIGSKTNKDLIFQNDKKEYKYLTGLSLSLMVSVIDIGAVVSYRLTNEAEGLPEEISFNQIFAPGLYFIVGFKKAPISLLLGGQLSPKLRNFNKNDDLSDTFRLSLGLSMDIPLFRLYHK